MVETAFRNAIDTYSWPPKFFFIPHLDSFYYLLFLHPIFKYLRNSALICVVATLLTILLATPASYALAILKIRGKESLMFGLLIGRVIPPVAFVLPFFLIATLLGAVDKHITMVVIYSAFNLPFAIWLVRSFLIDIPTEIRESSIVDGCSELVSFLRISVPVAIGGILTSGIFIFINCWNEFMFALTLTRENASTLPIMVVMYRTQFGIEWANMGAATIIVTTPVIVFALALRKYLLRGVTMGAIK
jgi:ABC-type glycerol-3-phosphate transport system permease component